MAQAGAAVGINYLGHREAAEELANEIVAKGGRAVALDADVSKEDSTIFELNVERYRCRKACDKQKDAGVNTTGLNDCRRPCDALLNLLMLVFLFMRCGDNTQKGTCMSRCSNRHSQLGDDLPRGRGFRFVIKTNVEWRAGQGTDSKSTRMRPHL